MNNESFQYNGTATSDGVGQTPNSSLCGKSGGYDI